MTSNRAWFVQMVKTLLCMSICFFCVAVEHLPAQSTTVPPSQKKSAQQEQRVFRVPFLLLSDFDSGLGNTPMIRVKISGRSYWFKLDMAATTCLIKESVLKEAGISKEAYPPTTRREILEANKSLYIDDKLYIAFATTDFGGFTVKDVAFVVARDKNIKQLYPADEMTIAGSIGITILDQFAVGFHYDRRELILFPRGKLSPDELMGAGFGDSDAVVDVFGPNKFAFYSVTVSCNGKKMPLVLDTGARASVLQVADGLLNIDKTKGKKTVLLGVFGEMESARAPVSFGVEGMKPVMLAPVFLTDDQKLPGIGNGVLGCDFLMHFNYLIDFPGRKMYLNSRKDIERDIALLREGIAP